LVYFRIFKKNSENVIPSLKATTMKKSDIL
jgi:hypothetical protein